MPTLSQIIEQDDDLKNQIVIDGGRKKGLYQQVCEILNRNNSFRKEYLDYCILNNIGMGKITKDTLKLSGKTGKKSAHLLIKGKYLDPDKVSYRLYHYAASYLKEKVENDEELKKVINNFVVDRRDNNSAFCLSVIIVSDDGKEIKIALGGDWIIDWNLIEMHDNHYECTVRTHTLVGHMFWPCKQINGCQTVNQARAANKVSIKNTLEVLEECYNNDFEMYEGKNSLYKAFCDNKQWYKCFGVKKDGFQKFIDFFALHSLYDEEIDCKNVLDVIEMRKREMCKDK